MILLFHHIQKTGGNTLLNAFEQKYGNTYRIHPGQNGENMTPDDAYHLAQSEEPIMISSHGPAHLDAIAQQCTDIDCYYLTLIREPLDRMVSHFAHLCRNKNNTLWPDIQRTMIDGVPQIDEFLKKTEDTELCNLTTKQLCRFATPKYEAAGTILKNYAYYGFTHRMVDTLQEINDKFGLELNTEIGKTAYNISQNRPLVENLPKTTIDLLQEHNQEDIKLWWEVI